MRPGHLLSGQGCPLCRKNKKKTHDEFVLEVEEKFGSKITVLGKYKTSSDKIRIHCNACDRDWSPEANEVVSKREFHICEDRGGKNRKTTDEFKQEVYELVGEEYLVMSEYTGVNKKILIKHNTINCKHEFKTTPGSFLNKESRCPKCFGYTCSRTTDDLKKEIFDIVGNEYEVLGEYTKADNPILMKHSLCGNEYSVRTISFLRGDRCPKCQHRSYAKTTEEFKEEVFKLAGNEYKVLGEYVRNSEKIKLRHNSPKCKSPDFLMTPSSFIAGQRCPKCKASKGEKRVREFLKERHFIFKEQYRIKDCKNIRPLPFDFAVFDKDESINCLIEYQGKQHYKGWDSGRESLENIQFRDNIKAKYCEDNHIKLLLIPYWEFENVDKILNAILNN
ncbi:hypothetical protein G9F71_008725 [Clostridium sp. FP2]|uniref:DUF2726 domain-containing protein n=1 Tax=Clostridium sp. FP2 TaxID=2724481 RepID=UPI0013E96043|nr:DUF2726 domain-containing protein [Clostridium sp. FP2]MBZ9622937.1 hypothetical protein [Clostridium sp. FP2]